MTITALTVVQYSCDDGHDNGYNDGWRYGSMHAVAATESA